MSATVALALCGSLRTGSLHAALLSAVAARAPHLRFVGGRLVPDLPLFRDDLDPVPAAVREFRLLAEAADVAIISSPEYLEAPSGVTTNALAWLAGCNALAGTPTLLMSASPGRTGGVRGLAGLLPAVLALGARPIDPVVVAHATDRIRPDGEVLDAGLDLRLQIAVDDLAAAVGAPAAAVS
ncbi:NAD(P)H-dependent FMN reductase [Diaminobutyricimonas aerilata]|uniref:NAD(P)H-dependent FMN reductase n=1 Tax=Diaminobutyricimonas aerilata TaxID=1162967 RepID=A0A2M9CGA4_9MICO|nr:NADPH-dependent FMN reductase [Diaminobutyricimonas aerilata]PJJ70907.1 NAD(P)H-dependent FMN reductase [Diaminobutyricimonas aerilata]